MLAKTNYYNENAHWEADKEKKVVIGGYRLTMKSIPTLSANPPFKAS